MTDPTRARCHPVERLAGAAATPGDGTNGCSGWCVRGVHHRCVGAHDAPCGCTCHQEPVAAALVGVDAAFGQLLAGGGVRVGHLTFRWSEVHQELEVTNAAGPRRFTLAEFGEMLDAVWGRDHHP